MFSVVEATMYAARLYSLVVFCAVLNVSTLIAQPVGAAGQYGTTTTTRTIETPNSYRTVQPLFPGTVYAPELRVPKDALNHFRNGVKVYNAGKYVEAEQHLRSACKLYPKYSTALAAWA